MSCHVRSRYRLPSWPPSNRIVITIYKLDTVYQDYSSTLIEVNPSFEVSLDTVAVKLSETIEVNIRDKPKDPFQQSSQWVGLIGGTLAGILAIISILKLIRKDKERAKEITELGSIASSLKSELKFVLAGSTVIPQTGSIDSFLWCVWWQFSFIISLHFILRQLVLYYIPLLGI